MAKGRREQIQAVIDNLNSIHIGELSAIEAKLAVARDHLQALEEAEVETVIVEAQAKLGRGDLGEFRRLMAQAVAKLGHVK